MGHPAQALLDSMKTGAANDGSGFPPIPDPEPPKAGAAINDHYIRQLEQELAALRAENRKLREVVSAVRLLMTATWL